MWPFKKKSEDLIDLRELQKKGILKVPNRMQTLVKPEKDGFVSLTTTPDTNSGAGDLLSSISTVSSTSRTEAPKPGFFDFFSSPQTPAATPLSSPDNSSLISSPSGNFSSDGYSKRETDGKIEDLTHMIWKLEQRLEALEKKVSVNKGW